MSAPVVCRSQEGDGGEAERVTVDRLVETSETRADARKARGAAVDRAEAQEQSETALPNPTLTYDREQFWQRGEVYAQDWFMVGQEVELPGVRAARSRSASARTEAAEHRQGRRGRLARLRLRREAYRMVVYRRRVRHAKHWVEQLESIQEDVRARVRKGRLSEADRQRVRTTYESARAALGSKRAALVGAKTELTRRMGREGGRSSWRLDASLETPAIDMGPDRAADRARRRGDLRAIEAEVRASEARAREARRALIEALEIHGGYMRIAEPGVTAHGFAVGASLPLPVFNQNRGESEAASARKSQLERRLAVERRRAVSRARGLARSANRRRSVARRFGEKGLSAARDVVEKTQSARDEGEATLMEVMEARRRLYEARKRHTDLLWRATRAELELLAAIGAAPGADAEE